MTVSPCRIVEQAQSLSADGTRSPRISHAQILMSMMWIPPALAETAVANTKLTLHPIRLSIVVFKCNQSMKEYLDQSRTMPLERC